MVTKKEIDKLTLKEIFIDGIGKRFARYIGFNNRETLFIIIMFVVGWFSYWKFFMEYTSFIYRFIPDFIMGFITCWIAFKIKKNRMEY